MNALFLKYNDTSLCKSDSLLVLLNSIAESSDVFGLTGFQKNVNQLIIVLMVIHLVYINYIVILGDQLLTLIKFTMQ